MSPSPKGKAPALPGSKTGKGKSTIRGSAKEKHTRPPSVGSKSTFRRQPGGPGSKVSNIAKHYERISRDTERANRRYAVIRGRRARPVASARAKVEVLDSVKDAIRDESESSDSLSEADDEGDGNDEGRSPVEKVAPEFSSDSPDPVPDVGIQTTPPLDSFPISPEQTPTTAGLLGPLPQPPLIPISLPPSPFLSSAKMPKTPSLTPPDLDIGPNVPEPERLSILKALSVLWLQPPPQSRRRGHEFEGDDIMSDPEHIFRDSSMVVRTDEPTSIIALALK
jgi:1-phosphatidylinositol-3-phosphate 5-kinase